MDVPVAIVGGGVMGLSAAWALGKRGVACAVLDPQPRRTERNASNDESKVFRLAYGERDDYSRLALRALEGWRALGRDAHVPVLHPHGLLMLGRDGGSFALRSADTLRR
ncbi:MAG: FAD-dependent oxidoreductase, partial [Halobacteriales archaeon]|nr:FAD-dependent oxidoreductase [Halobacteriales archaeon]